MQKYFVSLVLLLVVNVVGFAPASLLAAETPAANSMVETIHLNQASAEQLQALPGVGPSLSERIVAYRTENGPFKNVEQLTEVKGVGQAKLAKFRDHLIVN